MKGWDWYDLVWYAANHSQLHLKHLEQRMIQSGHLKKAERLTPEKLSTIAETVVGKLDVGQARREVEPFLPILRSPGRDHSIILFPDFDGFQISGGTDYLTGAAAITFCRINTWKRFIGFFIPSDLNCLIGAGP